MSSITWRRSSRCDANTCVEVALDPTAVAVRDGKDPHGPSLVFAGSGWRGFVNSLKTGTHR